MGAMRGKLITIEGGEGAGKSTNITFIKEYVEEKGLTPVMTREPGGTVLGERVRQMVLSPDSGEVAAEAELLLMFAARAQHIRDVIRPALEQGRWVICDRFIDASWAYQGAGRGIDSQYLAFLERWILAGLMPDMTLLLDLPVETGMARVSQRGASDRFEQEQLSFFERVRAAYRQRAEDCKDRFIVIDASQDLPRVQASLADALDTLLL